MEGELCGGLSFCVRLDTPGIYYLVRIYILPEMQGKGIASAAIQMCEKTVTDASLWILDYPVDQISNR